MAKRPHALFMLVLTLLGTAWGQNAYAWWNNDWAFRKEITFDLTPAGADISGTPTDVPILIRLSLGNFQYFGDTKPDGSDFASSHPTTRQRSNTISSASTPKRRLPSSGCGYPD